MRIKIGELSQPTSYYSDWYGNLNKLVMYIFQKEK